jgi:hypothetical protein
MLDTCHGRVLVERNVMEDEDNVHTIWDPTTDKQWDLPQLDIGEQLLLGMQLCFAGPQLVALATT